MWRLAAAVAALFVFPAGVRVKLTELLDARIVRGASLGCLLDVVCAPVAASPWRNCKQPNYGQAVLSSAGVELEGKNGRTELLDAGIVRGIMACPSQNQAFAFLNVFTSNGFSNVE